ncbi:MULTISPECIES: hypothetical protein [Pseudomonas]|jgi:hypothetical protein|uniref:Uncharacterized protein n=1 Tax=Pseudomonas germanica TaxID=2815720 RepID=A0ABX8YIM7_9PSED|nr:MULTISPECIES: hypothetical protein [Pseudomonas]PIF47960.1 hypothetical protein CLU80_0186 [Pseudomonas sp. 29]QYY79623.1 hypothetical protein J0G10_17980 [Pseudomonas germanica]
MNANRNENFPFEFQGLDLQSNTISLSKIGDIGAKVTPEQDMTRFNLALSFANGSSLDTNISSLETGKSYAIAPRWGLELSKGKTVNCLFRWWPGDNQFSEKFNVVD